MRGKKGKGGKGGLLRQTHPVLRGDSKVLQWVVHAVGDKKGLAAGLQRVGGGALSGGVYAPLSGWRRRARRGATTTTASASASAPAKRCPPLAGLLFFHSKSTVYLFSAGGRAKRGRRKV